MDNAYQPGWNRGPPFTRYVQPFANVVTNLIAGGTGQTTAPALFGYVNVCASAAGTGGHVLPATGFVSGTFKAQNQDAANGWKIWPPPGAQINTLGENVPYVVGPGQRIEFSTDSPATQWYAG